jgi:hypothetical protein
VEGDAGFGGGVGTELGLPLEVFDGFAGLGQLQQILLGARPEQILGTGALVHPDLLGLDPLDDLLDGGDLVDFHREGLGVFVGVLEVDVRFDGTGA